MSKQEPKSTAKLTTTEELFLMRMSIQATRDSINADLDALADQINRLLPPEDSAQQQRMKKYTKEDWKNYLKF